MPASGRSTLFIDPPSKGDVGGIVQRSGDQGKLPWSPIGVPYQNDGLNVPIRTLSLSLTSAGAVRTAGKLGLNVPIRTLSSSFTSAGALRMAGKLGLSVP